MKKTLFAILGIMVLTSLLGCETVKGVGRDIANTGTNIQKVVDKVTTPKHQS